MDQHKPDPLTWAACVAVVVLVTLALICLAVYLVQQ